MVSDFIFHLRDNLAYLRDVKTTNKINTKRARTVLVGRVVRKPVNANPRLKVNRDINFSFKKMLLTVYVLCSLRFFKLTTEGRTI